jgi:hypothetical protein
LHVLVPEGLWKEGELVTLSAPAAEEVEAILGRMVKELRKDFRDVEGGWPEDGLEALQAEGVQHRLALEGEAQAENRGRRKRLAVVEGFSLHADSWVHAHDRKGLERLCRYGSRGAIAEQRLSRRGDGRYEYRTKRGPILVLTAAQLVKRLVALIPPRGTHLTCFHGVYGPNAQRRGEIMLGEEQTVAPPPLGNTPERKRTAPKRPRMDWATLQRRTFGVDVWTCRCGGKRKVLAIVTSRRTAEELLRHLGLLEPKPPPPVAQGPPQLELAMFA